MASKALVSSLIKLGEKSQLMEKLIKKDKKLSIYEPVIKQSGSFLNIQFRDCTTTYNGKQYSFLLMDYLNLIDREYWNIISIMRLVDNGWSSGYEIVCEWRDE